MSLLDTDLEIARNSYCAATAVRDRAFPALAGDAGCDVAMVLGMAWYRLRDMLA
jgi:4-hydroxy-3-methylbut-2-enyl diphosphate reductase IspH